ncbi:DeoR/GlpR family DNA-binding transcription regulator [Streptomyces sp. NPDC001292]|uniref:DeoR/GlpR family DNA-binding transcription regulator n=1 Tax=Streptomyces sp. NPDC001292 TaxID=3364558 RepID=UPI0036B8C88B
MGAHTRWAQLLDILGNQGHVSIAEAAERLDCSSATIRRDMDELARQSLLTRTRGGAVVSSVAYNLPLRYKTARKADEKQRIAKAVAGLVPSGSVVGINGGTTTTEVARELAVRTDPGGRADGVVLTVVTNAINIANELAIRPHVKVVVTGGVARPNSYELVGPLVTSALQSLTFDCTILGVDAVHPHFGAATHDESEASANRSLGERGGTVIVVADSSKLRRRAFARVCALDAVSTLVTDKDAPESFVEEITAQGIEVLCV